MSGDQNTLNVHGACATVLNSKGNYFTLTRSLNGDCTMNDGGFAATVYPVISGYNLEDARIENLAIDGNRSENPSKIDGCRTAGIFLYRGDNAVIANCVVRDYSGDGISFQQSNDVEVRDCIVERRQSTKELPILSIQLDEYRKPPAPCERH